MGARRTFVAGILCVGLALAAIGGGGAAQAYEKLPRGLAKVTPAEVVDRIRIEDEPLEPQIRLSTSHAWPKGRSIKGAHAADVHLRALVDRESGAVRWQVWHELVYQGAPRSVVGVAYRAGGKLTQSTLISSEQWHDDCPGTDAIQRACNRYTRLVFELPGAVVREIADGYAHGSRAPWRLSFKGTDGASITGGLAPAEAAGLIHAVENLRSSQEATG